eukprot:scaffold142472_cov35-Tisochrysis_lutea.AAC.5
MTPGPCRVKHGEAVSAISDSVTFGQPDLIEEFPDRDILAFNLTLFTPADGVVEEGAHELHGMLVDLHGIAAEPEGRGPRLHSAWSAEQPVPAHQLCGWIALDPVEPGCAELVVVRHRPPSRGDASSSVTRTPRRLRERAHARPAAPPPTTRQEGEPAILREDDGRGGGDERPAGPRRVLWSSREKKKSQKERKWRTRIDCLSLSPSFRLAPRGSMRKRKSRLPSGSRCWGDPCPSRLGHGLCEG